uniref:Uncharacterized protein n=1 Tax=Amphimedon queenslandica TaxID=400682 RepID=A0A1X7UFP0_AMPQE
MILQSFYTRDYEASRWNTVNVYKICCLLKQSEYLNNILDDIPVMTSSETKAFLMFDALSHKMFNLFCYVKI